MTADPTGFDRLVTGGIVPGATRVDLAERELVVSPRPCRPDDRVEGRRVMTPDEVAADRAVIDAATGGEWQVLVGASWAGEVVVATSDGHPIAVVSTAPADPGAIADATAIAAARTGWPRALDALEVMADAVLDEMTRAEKAEAEVAALRERVADLEGQLAMRGTTDA